MDWKQYWDQIGSENTDFIDQVQRNHEEETVVTAEHIKKMLDINSNDLILDVCCGNGLLTNIISENCSEIIGVDQSEKLIEVANSLFKNKTCSFITSSVIEIPNRIHQIFDKIYLEFSFQYFDQKDDGSNVIKTMLKVLKPDGLLFIGDIPEKGKEGKLYNSFIKKIYRQLAKLKRKDTMGKFWSPDEISAICKTLKVKGRKITQPKNMPYSHYRFDFLIQK